MSATPPQEALEFRGNSHSPASPKPLHFPSPANIPILEKSNGPDFFSEQMMQNMHPNTFPSMAQHTIISALPQTVAQEDIDTKATTNGDDMTADSAIGSNSTGSGHEQTIEQSASDSQNNAANQSFLQGTHSSNVPSEAAAATSPGAEPTQGTANESSIDPSSSPTATQAPVYQSTGDVDTQEPSNLDALLANLAQPIPQTTPSESTLPLTPQTAGNAASPSSTLPSNPNLPPKPPAQEKPVTHPNYTPGDDIRSYHPHSQKDVAASYRTAHVLPSISTNLPPPPYAYQTPMSATVPMHSPAMSAYGHGDGTPMSSGNEEDAPFDRQLQQKFDAFLTFERQKVAEGQWDQFPPDSRLFIGNLPTEKVSKRDVFRRFHMYGAVAQISLKNAFGFVQFLDADACYRAVQGEQGTKIRGRDMHLEISKPQKHRANGGARRSRSPDYNRGARGQQTPRNVDRYTSGSQVSPRDRDYRRQRDDYRPGRSPSPRGYRNDRFDTRRRTRSRSPHGRNNVRQRSPLRRGLEDELSLPRRAPTEVPDVQILVLDDLNLQFIQWVEKTLQDRGTRVNVLMMATRFPEAALLRRQIVEGVQAIVKLTRNNEQRSKIPLQIFDRRGGVDQVKFEQYEDLDPHIAAELVLRAKQTHGAPVYGLPPAPVDYGRPSPAYGYPPPQPPAAQLGPPPPAAGNPNIANILGSLGVTNPGSNPELARLLANNPPQAQTGLTPDIARILGQINHAGPAPPMPQHQAPQLQAYGQPPPPHSANPFGTPTYGGVQLHAPPPHVAPTQQQQPPNPSPANLQQILAGLSNYKRPA